MGGKPTDWKGVMISSFGKTFLLPLDVALGWIFTNENRQRIFNKIGDTLIIKIKTRKKIKRTSDIKKTKCCHILLYSWFVELTSRSITNFESFYFKKCLRTQNGGLGFLKNCKKT
jgi:hypothetical protein